MQWKLIELGRSPSWFVLQSLRGYATEMLHFAMSYMTPKNKNLKNALYRMEIVFKSPPPPGGGGGLGTLYNRLHGEAPPERSIFFRLLVYKRVGISQVEVFKRVGESVI